MNEVKKKAVIISGDGNTIYWFRRELISELQKINYEVHALAPDIKDEYLESFNLTSVKFTKLDLKRKTINIFDSAISFFNIREILIKLDPSLLIAYTLKTVFLTGLSLRFVNIKNSTALITGLGHIFNDSSYAGQLKKLLVIVSLRFTIPSYRLVFFQNSDDKMVFIKYKIVRPEQIRMMNGSGVNLDSFRKTELVPQPVFLCISRLIKSKGLLEYAKAAHLIKSDYPNARFLLYGYPDSHSDSIDEKEIINSWKSTYGIEYCGFCMRPEETIARASVFVLLSHHEGTPRVVLEAMAIGLPIITTDAPGCKETVEHGLNGFLVPVGDYKSASKQMKKLMDKNLRISMGEASRKLAEEKFDVKIVNKLLIKEIHIT